MTQEAARAAAEPAANPEAAAREPAPERVRPTRIPPRPPRFHAPTAQGWVRLASVGAALALTIAVAIVWFTPALSVRNIEITGAPTLSHDQIREALGVAPQTPLLRVDTAAAAQRVAQLPKVNWAQVQRVYPSTLRVSIGERSAAAWIKTDAGADLIDPDGVRFESVAAPAASLPQLIVAELDDAADPARAAGADARSGAGEHAERSAAAALFVLRSLPQELRSQVAQLRADSPVQVELVLRDGRIVKWGGVEESERKARVALPLLSQPGAAYDISSPDLPSIVVGTPIPPEMPEFGAAAGDSEAAEAADTPGGAARSGSEQPG